MPNTDANATVGFSQVAGGDGGMINVINLVVLASEIYNYVMGATVNNVNRQKAYFENTNLEYCLALIIARGKAEIDRQIKTGEKTVEQRARAKAAAALGITNADEAKALVAELAKLRAMAKQVEDTAAAEAAAAAADKAKPKGK